MSQKSDKTLVGLAQDGNADAFCDLVDRYYGTVLSVARARCNDYATAEDIAQEAFLQAFLHIGKLRAASQFTAWVCRIAHNLSSDYFRKNRKATSITEQVCVSEMVNNIEDPNSESPDGKLETVENETLLNVAIEKLPVEQREIVLLHLVEKLSHKEIAQRLNIHASTVGRRYQRATAGLAESIGELLSQNIGRSSRTAARTVSAIMAVAGLSVTAKSAMAASAAGAVSATAYTSTIGSVITKLLMGFQNMFFTKSTAAVLVCAAVAGGIFINLRQTSVEDVYFDTDNPNGLSTTRMIVVWENGDKLPICFDGRQNSDTAGRIYAGWHYPEVRGTYDPYENQAEFLVQKPPRLVEVGSDDEKMILAAVQYWLEGKVGPSLEKQFKATNDFKKLPPDHQKLWHAYHSFHQYYDKSDQAIPVVHDGKPRVSDIHSYMDAGNHPGSIGFLLTTTPGDRIEICFDGRFVTTTPGRIYVGGTYVSDNGTRLVSLGSDQEKRILKELNSWVDLNDIATLFKENKLHRKTARLFRAIGQYEATYLRDDSKGIGRLSDERMKPAKKPKVIGISFANDGGSILVDAVTSEGKQIAFVYSHRLRESDGTPGNGRLRYRGKLVEFGSEEERTLLELCRQIARQNLSDEDFAKLENGTLNAANNEQTNIKIIYGQLQQYLKKFKNSK